jgi:uncharacterized protein
MADGPDAAAAQGKPQRKRFKFRPWLRALHRDLGYLAVGLTVMYALSGLAVNHIADWDPSFTQIEREFTVAAPLSDDDDETARIVQAEAGIVEAPLDVYRVSETELQIEFAARTLHVDPTTGRVFEEGQEPRLFLRVANWLHLNRGKKAWTNFADGYAIALLVLASTGLFMIPGRKGLLGRGAVLLVLGAAIPFGYLWWAGGP